jgi:arylsulfatase A-like enzyme
MLTGLDPPRHGVRLNTESRLNASLLTLPERLAELGYRTGAFVGASPMSREGGLDQGFEIYDDEVEGGGPRPERDAAEVFASAGAWLEGLEPGRPVFVLIHLFDPHWPYDRPPAGGSEPSYDGEIAHVDREIGAFLSSLPQTPRWRDALIVIVSDHGEALGEHGESSHGLLVYESTLRVAWILHHPGTLEPRRVSHPVGLVDLTPTLLDLAGGGECADCDGRSVVPLARGEAAERRELYFESLYAFLEFGWARLSGLRVGNLKYISAPEPELYDLGEDPGESVNLHDIRSDDASALAQRLEARGNGVWSRVEMGPEARARLESLGYVSARPVRETAEGGSRNPRDALEIYHRLSTAVALTDSDRHDEAYPVFESLESELRDSVQFHLKFAETAAGLERWSVARRLYERVLILDPPNQEALENLGVTHLKVREFRTALSYLERLLEINPEHVQAHYLAGLIQLWSLGDQESGTDHWARLLDLDPEHPKADRIRSVLTAYSRGEREPRALRERFGGSDGSN